MRRTRWIIAFLFAGVLLAQPQDAGPVYEAASVKLNTSGSGDSSSHGSTGQIAMTNLTLKRLIERAYGVTPLEIAGPAWLENVRVDIVAKYPPNTKADDRPVMLRALLMEYFRLAAHRETKDMPGYTLVVAKGGFKLKPVAPGGSDTRSTGARVRTLVAKKTSMAQLAAFIASNQGEIVADQTGLGGVYNFELRWTNGDQNPAGDADTAPSLFTALQETLGVRLHAQKVPVETVVVDRIERAPVEK
jgi:uncharacterized protein (TIGR03435 family)